MTLRNVFNFVFVSEYPDNLRLIDKEFMKTYFKNLFDY